MVAQLVLWLALSGVPAHLTTVLHELRGRADHQQLGPAQQVRRAAALAVLARYIERGEFPQREADGVPGRRPRFIDHRGVHCAVGHLIAVSGSPELARAINARYEYAYVPDIAEPALLDWAHANGFSVAELARIQPTYHHGTSPPTPEAMERQLLAATESMTIACASKHAHVSRVALHLTGDRRGRVRATTTGKEPFARCVAEYASRFETGDAADFEHKPQPFTLDVALVLPAPQQVLEGRLAGIELGSSQCTPRPGPIPARVSVAVATTTEGLDVRAVTEPNNVEIDRCVADRVERWLPAFAGIAGLAAKRDIPLVSRLATDTFTSELQITARSIALSCDPEHDRKAKYALTMTAKRDDADFSVALATKHKKLAACVRERLVPYWRDRWKVSRLVDGKAESYFRIDTDVNVTVPIFMNR